MNLASSVFYVVDNKACEHDILVISTLEEGSRIIPVPNNITALKCRK